MLEMPDGIPKETMCAIRSIFQYPSQGRVRPWPCFQDGVILGNIGGKRPVELQDGLGWFSRKPVALRKTEGIQVKSGATIRSVTHGQGLVTIRKIRAWRHSMGRI